MWKPLVVLAIVANTALISPSEGTDASSYSEESVEENPHRKCKNPNEIYDLCPNPCPPRRCGVNPALILCAPGPEPGSKDCKPGCICKKGFLKNRAGICIPEKECQYDCAKNQTLDSCYSDCPPRYCGVNIAAVSCLAIDESNCKRGCRCKDGYLKNANGDCVREKDCPKCYGPNEVYDVCLNPCPLYQCNVDPRVIKCAAPPEPGDPKCEAGCRCLEGYARTDEGICVPRDQCPPKCGEDEVYSTCTNSDCGPQNCSQLGYPIACPRIDPAYCEKGCVCKEGLVRDENGICIPKEKCPSCGGDPNAESGCGSNCGRLCSNYNSSEPAICPEICILNGCDCKDGFVLDESTGKCILPNQCVSCNGDSNAKSGCDKNCTKRCPGPKPAECKCYGCECKDGFVYDPKTRKCVRPERCTPPCGDNEILSNCSNGGCGPWRCTDVGIPTGCVKMDQKYCKVDCVCKEGYVRDDKEVCVPVSKCPECGGDPNAVAGCGINCGRLCSNYKFAENVSCIAVCYDNACDCRKGFVLDENINKCVKPEHCTPTCGKNEVFSECINGGCEAKNCSQLGKPVPCVRPAKCKPGCLCAEGYLRDAKGNCVPKDQCSAPVCKKHEVYSECTNGGCQARNCSQLGQPVPCIKLDPKSCIKGCVCEDGYLRARNGTCVPEDKCDTPVCKKHEVYSECTNGGCQARNCSQLGQPVPCIKLDPKSCIKGCVCEDGYLRARNGTCVPEDKCDNCNKPHEHYDSCAPSCPPQTCESIGKTYECPITAAVCRGACRCDKGYYRNKIGDCIPEKKCLECKGPHEYWSCGSACDNVCATLYKQNQTNCPIQNIKCNEMCYCEKGYARDKNKVCIPIDKCPKPKCGKNERIEQCPPALCTPQNCSELGYPVACPDLPMNGVCPEPPGCVCADNHVRDSSGKCIPSLSCPSCGGDPNAVSGCGVNCGRTCTTYNRTDISCIQVCYFNACDCRKGYVFDEQANKCVKPKDCSRPCGKNEVYTSCANGGCGKWNCSQLGQPDLCIDPIKCIGGCTCQKGYLRAKNGTCVPIKQCPVPSCGKNERFEFCPGCEPQYCSELGFPLTCPASTDDSSCPGQPACICNNGFVRNESGDCIPKKDCPSCGGDPHAVSGCGVNCGRLCSNYNKGPVPCPKICKFNACDCKKDFVLDQNINKCVRPKKCTPICGQDEVFSECINGGCQRKNCSQLGQPVPCVKIAAKDCIKGCLCKEGYLRNSKGVCVPQEKCELKCNQPNEVYDSCPSSCPPQTCESIDKIYHCPLKKTDLKDCKPACRCKEGYWRNKIGQCISKENCLKCKGPNEFWSCGGACDNICKDLHKQNQTNCPIVNIKCNEMCYCEKGYARNDKKICVPIEQCPKPPKCKKNERLEECPDWLCRPQSCAQLGYPIACPALQGDIGSNATCPGKPGCVCIDNYVRHDCGECIPAEECLSCGGDPNAVSGCGVNCGRLCSNYKKKNVICPLICKVNGCDCKKGFVFDSNIGKCVRPKDCTEVCGENEVYDTCANGGCRRWNCSQKGGPILCKDPLKCIGGCVCQKGYLRNNDGACVPEDKCPITCTQPHEVYDPCPHTCPPQTCAAIGIAYPCPHPPEGEEFCTPACRCENGYYRNSAGECISEEECLKCTGPNEHFSCGRICDNECATLKTQNRTNCPYVNKRCYSKCYCDEGYARDGNGICIPVDQCGVSCNGDPNAVPGCGSYCGNRCSNYNKGPVACPLICRLGACDCKQTYVYDDNLGKCVQPKNCTPVCGKDEVYNACINGGCQKKNCSDLARPNICIHPKECKDGCLCKEGMLRAKNGTCVPIDKCPTPVCPKNEVFDRFANGGCERRTCSDLTRPILCIDPVEFIGACVCVKGFLRNDDGICVPECQCNPQCNQPNQVFNRCPSSCPPQTCESLGRAYVCPIETGQEPPCQPGCVCKEGFFFNKIGECISEEECLQCTGPNEYYSCGVECDNVCLTLNEQSQTDCPIVNIKCNEMCYCEAGYARNASKICIPIKDCPPSRCGVNERYEPHPCELCGPLTCSEVNKEQECPPPKDENCDDTPACVCKYGLVRNKAGHCVPISECSSETAVNVTDARARLDQGSVSLSATFLHYLVSKNPNDNCVASPTSLLIPLAQLALYARGSVLEQLLKLLNLKNKEEIKACFPELIAEFSNQTGVDFKEATKYYANENYALSQGFKTDSKKYFGAEGENVDFSQPEEAADLINEWVYNQTRGKIQDLVKPEMFDEDTRLCLVNAIYFLGNWVKQFNPENTEEKDFYKANGETVPVKTMYQQNTFNYAETDQYQVLEMPYEGYNFSFVIVLPNNKEGLLPTLKTIQEPGHWDGIMKSLTPQKCQVYIPKMTINTQIDVKTLLVENGADEMFDPTSDGFEGMLEKPEPVYVTDAVQKAFLALDEKGTEAAAATAIIVGLRSASVPSKIYEFKANRPFAFYLVYKKPESSYKTALFCGTFVEAQ
ncbi:hypothetical protein PYW07_015215 [Mythimna separata]|uniref:Zonadhesin-like n=1 Tax=Mythimna separata TaxID=271217 RepID=A0AAD8DYR5_MYTSE|nr:hypothetical protein PYW07_015215 [Mythimna separata]